MVVVLTSTSGCPQVPASSQTVMSPTHKHKHQVGEHALGLPVDKPEGLFAGGEEAGMRSKPLQAVGKVQFYFDVNRKAERNFAMYHGTHHTHT